MGGDCSQKLRPWRGIDSSPGHSKPPAHWKINTLSQKLRLLYLVPERDLATGPKSVSRIALFPPRRARL